MSGKKKWFFNIGFLLLVIGLTLYGLFRGSDRATLLSLFQQANPLWWLLGLVLVVAFILGESLVLHDIMRTLKTPHRLTHCFLYSFIGFLQLHHPSAGGGQPAQVYFMRKDGIDAAVSVPVMLLVTITYKLVLVIFALGVLIFRPALVMTALEPVWAWCILGIVLNGAFYRLLHITGALPRRGGTDAGLLHPPPRQALGRRRQKQLLAWLHRWWAQYRDVSRCFRRPAQGWCFVSHC